jgi:beta-fructofuranosidase
VPVVLAVLLPCGLTDSAPQTERNARDGNIPLTLDLQHLERCWRADRRVAAKQAAVDSDPFRPTFHVLPAAGACGDPNGPIYANRKYHLFFQHAPELVHGKPVEQWEEYEGSYSHTGWGHASSRDLVYWEHEPIALMPERGSYDPNLCASGSAVLADDGTVLIFYTAAEPQRQCIARSVDPHLRWWRKDPANPILSEPPVPDFIRGGFRDPFLWREGDEWHMIVGGGIRSVGGTALHFRSTNLTDWTYIAPLAAGMGEHCIAWECPNFVPLSDGQALLVVSPLFDNMTTRSAPRSDVVYTIGSYREGGAFQPAAWNRLDIGGPDNFYATQVLKTPDGRWLLWGMNLGGGSVGHDWTTNLSLPRVLTLHPNGLLGQEPPAELQQLRRAHWSDTDKTLTGDYPLGVQSNTCEIVAEIDVGDAQAVGMDLRASEDFQTGSRIWLDVEAARWHAGQHSDGFRLLDDEQNVLRIHAFVDRSVIEVFINRRQCATLRAFHDIEAKAMRLFSQGGAARIRSVDVWEMGSIWQPPPESPD